MVMQSSSCADLSGRSIVGAAAAPQPHLRQCTRAFNTVVYSSRQIRRRAYIGQKRSSTISGSPIRPT
jgi:hypothetical protein